MRNFREIHAENAHPHLQSGKIQIFLSEKYDCFHEEFIPLKH